MRSALLLASLSVALPAASLVASCSSGSTTSTSGGIPDGGAGADGADGSSGSSGASGGDECNKLTQQGSPITLVVEDDPAPAATAGPITDGTYVVTKALAHIAALPDGQELGKFGKLTLEIKGTVANTIQENEEGSVSRSSATVVITGTELDLVETCAYPKSDAGRTIPSKATYTATPTLLKTFLEYEGVAVEVHYEKQ